MLSDARHRQELVHTAEGKHEPVVVDGAAPPLSIGVINPAGREIDTGRLCQDQPYVANGFGEGDGRVARIQ
jgi:hypothetical protein